MNIASLLAPNDNETVDYFHSRVRFARLKDFQRKIENIKERFKDDLQI